MQLKALLGDVKMFLIGECCWNRSVKFILIIVSHRHVVWFCLSQLMH